MSNINTFTTTDDLQKVADNAKIDYEANKRQIENVVSVLENQENSTVFGKSPAYVQEVPLLAEPYATINKIGGITRKVVQLAPAITEENYGSLPFQGINETWDRNKGGYIEDGHFVQNCSQGAESSFLRKGIQLNSNHKYLVTCEFKLDTNKSWEGYTYHGTQRTRVSTLGLIIGLGKLKHTTGEGYEFLRTNSFSNSDSTISEGTKVLASNWYGRLTAYCFVDTPATLSPFEGHVYINTVCPWLYNEPYTGEGSQTSLQNQLPKNTLVYNLQVFDLTKMYGFGREPDNILDFRRDYSKEYYEQGDYDVFEKCNKVVSYPKNMYKHSADTNDWYDKNGSTINAIDFNSITLNKIKNGQGLVYRTQRHQITSQTKYIVSFRADSVSANLAKGNYRVAFRFYSKDDDLVLGAASTTSGSKWNYNDYYCGWYCVPEYDSSTGRFYAKFDFLDTTNATDETLTKYFAYYLDNCREFEIGIGFSGGSASTHTIYDIQLSAGDSISEYEPYQTPVEFDVPNEILALDGYGEGENENSYNYLDLIAKKFYNTASGTETDVSSYVSDNLIKVFSGGNVFFKNEDGIYWEIPNEVKYPLLNNSIRRVEATANSNKKKIENIASVLKGVNYNFSTGTTPTIVQPVIKDCEKYASIDKIGGVSKKVVQLAPKINVENYGQYLYDLVTESSAEGYGIIYDGYYTSSYPSSDGIVGLLSSSLNFQYNHKYCISFTCRLENPNTTTIYMYAGKKSQTYLSIDQFTSPANQKQFNKIWMFEYEEDAPSDLEGFVGIMSANAQQSIKISNLQVFDLTEMYGAGHEPTNTEAFGSDFSNNYYEFGTYYINSKCDKVVSIKKNIFNAKNREELDSVPENWTAGDLPPIDKPYVYKGLTRDMGYWMPERVTSYTANSENSITIKQTNAWYGVTYNIPTYPGYYYRLSTSDLNNPPPNNGHISITFVKKDGPMSINVQALVLQDYRPRNYPVLQAPTDTIATFITIANTALPGSTEINPNNAVTFDNIMLEVFGENPSGTAITYESYVAPVFNIPEEITSMDGYGLGLNNEKYNYVDFESKTFHKNVEIRDNIMRVKNPPEIVDVSEYTEDNFIETFADGKLIFGQQNSNFKLPNEVVYMVDVRKTLTNNNNSEGGSV